jgi:hypothetical protein
MIEFQVDIDNPHVEREAPDGRMCYESQIRELCIVFLVEIVFNIVLHISLQELE